VNRIHHWFCGSGLWRRGLDRLLPWVLERVDPGDHILEVGPGPGLVNAYLRGRYARITPVEIDEGLARSLARRVGSAIVCGDATRLPFASGTFSSVLSVAMLHHVPSAALQDALLAEARRVLRPGGLIAGSDSRDGWAMRLMHTGDTMTMVDPDSFGARLERAGFRNVQVDTRTFAFRFRGTATNARIPLRGRCGSF
jgi:SAM-dependent methyltransferase